MYHAGEFYETSPRQGLFLLLGEFHLEQNTMFHSEHWKELNSHLRQAGTNVPQPKLD